MTHLFDESLYAEAQQFNKRAGRDDLTTPTLIESLAFSRDAVRRLDEEYKEHIKPFKDSMKPYETDRSALKKVFEGAAEKFEERLLSIFKKQKSLPEETNNGVRLTVALLPRLGLAADVVWDAVRFNSKSGHIYPEDFLLPPEQCIDWKKVQAAKEAGEELPPWIEQFNAISFRTKLPEVIE